MATRKEQQAELLIKLGLWIAPLKELIEYPEQQTSTTKSRAGAKFIDNLPIFKKALSAFCKSEPGHNYQAQILNANIEIMRFQTQISSFLESIENSKSRLFQLENSIRACILSIPCEIHSEPIESGSPFTAFIKLCSIFETANNQLILIDKYVGPEIIRRYFHFTPKHVQITVITGIWKRGENTAFDNFIELSKLYQLEYGKENFHILQHPNLHDRFLKCDDTIYSLGGSLKDAGKNSNYTISEISLISNRLDEIKKILSEGKEFNIK